MFSEKKKKKERKKIWEIEMYFVKRKESDFVLKLVVSGQERK